MSASRRSDEPARQGAADKRRLILDAAVRVFARQGFHACRVSDIADEAGVAYGLVYHYFASKDEVLDTLFLERWEVMLELISEVDARADPGAREARRDRFVHHRQLPPRPRPDEGDHRRGDARGELVRRHAHRHDPRGLRPDRRRSSPRLRSTASSRPRSSALRGDGLLRRDRAAADRLDLRPAAAGRGALRARQAVGRRDGLRRPSRTRSEVRARSAAEGQ